MRPKGTEELHPKPQPDSLRVGHFRVLWKEWRACAYQRAPVKVSSFPGHPSTSALPLRQMCSDPCRKHLLVLFVGNSHVFVSSVLILFLIFDAIRVFRISHFGTKEYELLGILESVNSSPAWLFFFLSSKGLIHLMPLF